MELHRGTHKDLGNARHLLILAANGREHLLVEFVRRKLGRGEHIAEDLDEVVPAKRNQKHSEEESQLRGSVLSPPPMLARTHPRAGTLQ